MTAEDYANEAKRLLADNTFKSALSTVYENAREGLVTVKADDITAVLRLQAKAQVIEEVLAELNAAIIAMAPAADQEMP